MASNNLFPGAAYAWLPSYEAQVEEFVAVTEVTETEVAPPTAPSAPPAPTAPLAPEVGGAPPAPHWVTTVERAGGAADQLRRSLDELAQQAAARLGTPHAKPPHRFNVTLPHGLGSLTAIYEPPSLPTPEAERLSSTSTST